MEVSCHRCNELLPAGAAFCPHCGAPQLQVDSSIDTAALPGAPEIRMPMRSPHQLDMTMAMRAALLVGIPLGILSSFLDFGSLLVLGGGFAGVALYKRFAGTAATVRTGWRIGALLGLLAAGFSATLDGITMVIQRYLLHAGPAIDERLHAMAEQMTTQMAQQNPQAAAQIPWFLHFWLTPDGAAAIALMVAAFSSLGMILFSAVGGAVGGRVLSARGEAQRSL